MAEVFLSYDHDDLSRARLIAAALEQAGHSVWWDRNIKGGSQYSKEIEDAVKRADAVVVLWSESSIESAWVRDEAAAGRDRGRLVPALLGAVAPPLGFRQYQTIDLSGWKGRGNRALHEALTDAVATVAGGAIVPEPSCAPSARSFRRPLAAALLLLVLLSGSYLAWRAYSGRSDSPRVAVAPAADSPAGHDFANDLLVQLGKLQSSAASPIRLIDSDEPDGADLLLKVNGSTSGHPRASLVLQSSRNGTVLWSGDFEQPSGGVADLKQQVAVTAARVLACASEAMPEQRPRLKLDTYGLYLNGCAKSAEMLRADPTLVVRMLSRVVGDAPGFRPAWAKLLIAEIETTGLLFNEGEQPTAELAAFRKHIEEAERHAPGLPEVAIARATLLGPRDFSGRIKLVERAVAATPDDPDVQSFYAGLLASVGRSQDGIKAAARAVGLDPLSPTHVNAYISALAYGGSTDAARRELDRAERLWPGTASVRDAQLRFHLRYGDPQIAKAIFLRDRDTGTRAWRMFADARADPSPAKVEQLMAYVGGRLKSMANPSAGIGFATLAYGHFGQSEKVLATLLGWPKPDDLAALAEVLFRPELRGARHDRRFMQIAHRAGLTSYWQSSGKWPDFCFENDLPYDCKTEEARLTRARN